MTTVFDWLTVMVFAGLIVLFLQRSTDETPRDELWQYLIPSVGCAVCNYLGNEGYTVFAILVLVAVLGYIHVVLKPFGHAR
jgi:hypothetical protein